MTATDKQDTAPQSSSPQADAAELGVQLTKALQPNLRDFVPSRFVPESEAKARGWSMFYDGRACRYGHQAAAYVSNSRRCSDCVRVKAGLEPIYPKSRAQEFFSAAHVEKIRDAKLGITPAAAQPQPPAAPREPSPKEQKFLESLALTGEFKSAAESAGMSRGQIEARASVDPTFKSALTDLCERLSIPWTNPTVTESAKGFAWTDAIEKQLIRRYIDSGLIESARQELGISASDYQQRLTDNPDFAAAIDAARTPARETLKERALQAADRGNDRLLKALEDEADENFTRLPDGTKVRRLGNPDVMREEMAALLKTARENLAAKERLREVAVARLAERRPQPSRDYDLIEEAT